MVAFSRQTASGGTRFGACTSRGTSDAIAKVVHDGSGSAAETVDRSTRARDQGDEREASEIVGREYERGDERQDLEDSRYQGGSAEGEAAEQHEEVHGGTKDRTDDTEQGKGQAQGHP